MIKNLLLAFVPIFVAVDAIGVLPIFISFTHDLKKQEKSKVILQSMVTALGLVVGFIFLGKAIRRFSNPGEKVEKAKIDSHFGRRSYSGLFSKVKTISNKRGGKRLQEINKEAIKMPRKTRVICLTLVMFFISGILGSTVLAEERPKRVISVTGAGLVQLYEEEIGLGDAVFRGAIGLEFEKVTSPSSSTYITPAVSFGRKALGVRATLGLKNYFEPTAPEGLWWGVFGSFGLGADWGPEKDWGVSVSTVGAGVNLGYKYLLPKNFTGEWSFGVIYLYRSGEDIDVGGVGPRIEVKFGYAF